MENYDAKEYLKNQLIDYLSSKGIGIKKKFNCLNPEHSDNNPSMSYDKKSNLVHCFSCGVSYDIFDLVGLDYNLTEFKDKYNKTLELYDTTGIDITSKITKPAKSAKEEDLSKYFELRHRFIESTDYPSQRGLSKKVLDRFNIGYDPSFYTQEGEKSVNWQAMIIPTGKGSYTARNTNKEADKENRIRKSGSSPIYNFKALNDSNQPIFIVEGEIDALSVIEADGEAIALGSTSNVDRFLKLINENKPSQRLIVSLDNDTSGETAALKLIEELNRLEIPYSKVNISGEYKDPNEALTANRGKFMDNVKKAILNEVPAEEDELEEYLQTSAKHHLRAFTDGIKESVNTPFIPTGFPRLDALLDGGLFEGLYIVGAISSLGKTTLLIQIADQIAKSGTDVLIFSLEMARSELMAKSISRETLISSGVNNKNEPISINAKTTRGITTGKRYASYSKEEKDLIVKSINGYGQYADRIFISEGIGDIGAQQVRETVEKHIDLTGRKPIVIIDYLQILAPYNERMSDKQNIDKAVLELKRISRDHKIPVIGISSFNRANYENELSMSAFKESGAIEYSSDVLIGLQFKNTNEKDPNFSEAKKKNPRQIELKVLKNRNGRIGTVSFSYFSYFNYFREWKDENRE